MLLRKDYGFPAHNPCVFCRVCPKVCYIKGKKAASYHRWCSVIPNQMDQNVSFQRWIEMDGPCHDGPNSVLDGTLSKITHHLQLLQVMPHQPELPRWSFSSPFLSQICHRTVLFALKNPPKSIPS